MTSASSTIVEEEQRNAPHRAPNTRERKREQIVHMPLTAEQSYEKHCKACEVVYADGVKQKKCKEIAKILRDKKNRKDYVEYTPNESPCACQFPEWPTGDVCFLIYYRDANSPDPNVRECAEECFISCVLSNPALHQVADPQ